VISNDIYTRRLEQCFKIDGGNGETVYELVGIMNGHTVKHSVAYVEIAKDGFSSSHYHPEMEESYLILEGEGVLYLDGNEQHLKKGDVAHIPKLKTHQIFNRFKEELKFYCVCAPAWTFEGFHLQPNAVVPTGDKVFVNNRVSLEPSILGDVTSYELLKENHVVTEVEIAPNGSTIPSMLDQEESYVVTQGKGLVRIGDMTKEVSQGELTTIPERVLRQITNVGTDVLKFYAIRA